MMLEVTKLNYMINKNCSKPKDLSNYNSIKYRIQNRHKNTANININFKIKTEFRQWQPYMNVEKNLQN